MANKHWEERCREKRRFWQVHIRAWRKSGLTQNEYCKRNNLRSNQLCYWKKKFKNAAMPSVTFVPVPVQQHQARNNSGHEDSGLTIILDDVKIKLSNNFNTSVLVKAVSALGGRS